jgi:N utilization substance protein B
MMDGIAGENAIKNPVAQLQKSFDSTRELLVYILYFITEVSRYAETDAVKKANKLLPSTSDLNVNTKISGNKLFWKIIENESFKRAIIDLKPERLIDTDMLKRVYNKMAESEPYKEYINTQSRDKQNEKEVLKYIFTDLMLADEDFTSHLEELFNNWDDDCELMEVLIKNYLSKPSSFNLQEIISSEKWEFAKSLLISTFNKKSYLLDLIKPKLQNWDSSRIVSVDMVLIQMGLCEFLYFESIPPKVTMNEYIDIAKTYSTEQSGHFINGILDSIHREMSENGSLNKIAYISPRTVN